MVISLRNSFLHAKQNSWFGTHRVDREKRFKANIKEIPKIGIIKLCKESASKSSSGHDEKNEEEKEELRGMLVLRHYYRPQPLHRTMASTIFYNKRLHFLLFD